MKAIVYRKYGSPDVLSFEEVDRPIPKDVKFSMSDKMIYQDLTLKIRAPARVPSVLQSSSRRQRRIEIEIRLDSTSKQSSGNARRLG